MRHAVPLHDAPRGGEVPATVEQFLAWLGGPTVLAVAGSDRGRRRGLATLLHGNEPSGVRALHAYLRGVETPAVDLLCFVGAVDAALAPPGFAHRMLPGRRDLNRCFQPPWLDREGAVAGEALRLLREAGCEALVDLHNNTGHNPPYGVGVSGDAALLNLTALFAERYVWSDIRLGALIEATAGDFPTVTIECGRAGDPAADALALAGLRRYAALERVETRLVQAPGVTVLSRPVRVCARPGIRLAFGHRHDPGADLTLAGDIDRHNFQTVLPGAPVGWLASPDLWPIEARGADGEDVSRDLFVARGDRLETRRGIVPIMMTTDPVVATADCLFYVVQPVTETNGDPTRRTARAPRRAR